MTLLHHIALGAYEPGSLADFYRTVLGLEENTRHFYPNGELRSVWLNLGRALLMIEKTTADVPRFDTIGKGPFLLAISVDKTEREQFEAKLIQSGCDIEYRTAYTSYTRDPEGNRLAISHYPIHT